MNFFAAVERGPRTNGLDFAGNLGPDPGFLKPDPDPDIFIAPRG